MRSLASRVANEFLIQQEVVERFSASRPMKPEKLRELMMKVRKWAVTSMKFTEFQKALQAFGGWTIESGPALYSGGEIYHKWGEQIRRSNPDRAVIEAAHAQMAKNVVSHLPSVPQVKVGQQYVMDLTDIEESGGKFQFSYQLWDGEEGVHVTGPLSNETFACEIRTYERESVFVAHVRGRGSNDSKRLCPRSRCESRVLGRPQEFLGIVEGLTPGEPSSVYGGRMSWLDKITKEMLANLPKGRFQPVVTFGFADIMAVIAIGERAVKDNYDATLAVHQERAEQAAMDPDHSFIENPVFAPMGAALFTADLTFSLILRRSMFIAICSHVEHVLRTWCSWLEREWTLPKTAKNLKRLPGESDLHHCVRYLRDEAGLSAIDRFETWPEWLKIDACRLARNCLTHNGGVVESAADAATISTLNAVTVDDSGLLHQAPVVHLLEGACEDAATNAKAFFERLTLIAEADPRSPK